jgi:hypothetical protein
VPVELPHVLVTVAADGTLTAPSMARRSRTFCGAWTRATFGPLMDAITKDRTVAVRVEVRECDGSVFTDIIRARKPRRAEPLPRGTGAGDAAERATPPGAGLMEVTAEGFVPGEDVAVASSSPTPTPPEPATPARSSTSTTCRRHDTR